MTDPVNPWKDYDVTPHKISDPLLDDAVREVDAVGRGTGWVEAAAPPRKRSPFMSPPVLVRLTLLIVFSIWALGAMAKVSAQQAKTEALVQENGRQLERLEQRLVMFDERMRAMRGQVLTVERRDE
jgi:hypothetical protein